MATKSIGATGRDYATLALWASYVNALALTAPEVGEMYADSEFTPGSRVDLGGWTGGSSSNTVTLRCATGQSFRDNANVQTNALRYNSSNGVAIGPNLSYSYVFNVTTDNIVFDGLQIRNTNSNCDGVTQFLANNVTIQNCIIQAAVGGVFSILVNTAGTTTMYNNLFLITNNQGTCLRVGDLCTVTSNTIVGASANKGVQVDYSGAPVFRNNVISGFTTNTNGTAGATSSNNATDKASFGGTNFNGGGGGQFSLTGSTEFESVSSGTEDYRLKSTSAKLKDNGATVGPSTDIAKTSRPQGSAYDIGCWELVAAAADTLFAQACF